MFIALFIIARMWMEKQYIYIYMHNKILFSFKKTGDSEIYYNMDKPWGHYAKWNKPITKRKILYDSSYVRFLEQSQS